MKPSAKPSTTFRMHRTPREPSQRRPRPRLRFPNARPSPRRRKGKKSMERQIAAAAGRVLARRHLEATELLCRSPRAMRLFCRLTRRELLDSPLGQTDISDRRIIELMLQAIAQFGPRLQARRRGNAE